MLTLVTLTKWFVVLLNCRTDKVVMEFLQEQGSVTALTFRSEPRAPNMLVSGSSSGALVCWDLDKKKLAFVREEAHLGAVVEAKFLPGEPRLVSSGADNSLQMWIFDLPDGSMRLLKGRQGAAGPIRKFDFYGELGTQVLVASEYRGQGLFGRASLIQQHRDKQWSQSVLQKVIANKGASDTFWPGLRKQKRLPPIVDSAFSHIRHFDWAAVVTCHQDYPWAFVWSAATGSLIRKTLCIGPVRQGESPNAICVDVSVCGNFAVVGYEDGSLHRYNMQSGLHRGPFLSDKYEQGEGKQKKVVEVKAHTARVCSVIMTVGSTISACSDPNSAGIKIWNTMSQKLLKTVDLSDVAKGAHIQFIRASAGSDVLVAVAFSDGRVVLVDLDAERVVRQFESVGGASCTDIAFSSDGRWLCVANTTARAAATASTSESTAAGSTISSRSKPSPWAPSAAAAAALAALSQLWCDA